MGLGLGEYAEAAWAWLTDTWGPRILFWAKGGHPVLCRVSHQHGPFSARSILPHLSQLKMSPHVGKCNGADRPRPLETTCGYGAQPTWGSGMPWLSHSLLLPPGALNLGRCWLWPLSSPQWHTAGPPEQVCPRASACCLRGLCGRGPELPAPRCSAAETELRVRVPRPSLSGRAS